MRALIVFCVIVLSAQADEYLDKRASLIEQELLSAVGGNLVLNEDELALNEILMAAKEKEFILGYANPCQFPPAEPFFFQKNAIEESEVFAIIRDMPKFGALHTHDMSWCSVEYLINNITYRDNLYVCIVNYNPVNFTFADSAPTGSCWNLLQDVRDFYGAEEIDRILYNVLTLEPPFPFESYENTNAVWVANGITSSLINSIIQYREVFLDYYTQALQEFYDDNVMYVELRTPIPYLYELDGTITSDPMVIFPMLVKVTDNFQAAHPDFMGVKFIYCKNRHATIEQFTEYINTLQALVQAYPTNLIGFDINGQEETGLTLFELSDQLRNINPPIPFYFHSGQTLSNGMPADENLFDAILLNSVRIGQPYALTKHPALLKMVKDQDIAIEISPITNQILLLIPNLLNHDGSYLIANNYSVVISSSDPGMWGAKGISPDVYEAFTGLASRHADLRMLKQFFLNSIYYSGLNSTEKANAAAQWQTSWDVFVKTRITPSSTTVNSTCAHSTTTDSTTTDSTTTDSTTTGSTTTSTTTENN